MGTEEKSQGLSHKVMFSVTEIIGDKGVHWAGEHTD